MNRLVKGNWSWGSQAGRAVGPPGNGRVGTDDSGRMALAGRAGGLEASLEAAEVPFEPAPSDAGEEGLAEAEEGTRLGFEDRREAGAAVLRFHEEGAGHVDGHHPP